MVRNLLYRITPFTGSSYLFNLQELFKRIDIFNGRKIFAIAHGEGCEDPDFIANLLTMYIGQDFNTYYVPVENTLWENTSFVPLLKLLKKDYDENSITAYLHSKGVTRSKPDHVWKGYEHDIATYVWTLAMYKYNLDQPYLTQIEEAFKKGFHCAGSFRRFGTWKHFPIASKWHYSGNFCWFNQTELFKRDWQKIAPTKFGPESYWGTQFDKKESFCVAFDKLRCEPYKPECLKALGLLP